MKTLAWSTILLATLLSAGCGSKGSPQSNDAPPQAAAEPAPAPKPVVTCVALKPKAEAPAKTSKSAKAAPQKKPAAKPAGKSTAKTTLKEEPTPAASPVADANGTCPAGYEAVVTQPAAAAAPAKAAEEAQPAGKEVKPQVVKSKDGSFDGEVYGKPAPGSKLAKIQIGMTELEVKKLIGFPDDQRAYVTGKAFIPFYFGSDSARVEWIYRGYGSLAFDAGRWGGGGVVMMINHDPKIE